MRLPKGLSTRTAVFAAAVTLVGAGTFAAWTSTSSSTTGTLAAANVVHTNVDAGTTTFSSALSNMLPGDFLYRYRTLTNTGSVDQTFTGAVSGSGALAAVNGLTLSVDSCSVAWTGPLCTGGTSTSLLSTAGVSTAPAIPYGSLTALTGALNLRYKFSLPSGADQTTFQNTTGTVTVAITGATAAASDRTAA